ncbi:MAG TPA: amidohydrolase [Bacteroidales bacterium]|nr:amidohydrolase [Bacteroidales bacterium]
MMRKQLIICLLEILVILSVSCTRETADLILLNGEIYTMDEANPWATAIVIKENLIAEVIYDKIDTKRWTGTGTRVVDLEGAFVVPGFIDGHVHFNNAGALINDINLMKVSDDAALVDEIKRITGIVGPGEWITGGQWGAYEEWGLGASGSSEAKGKRWEPSRIAIDDITAQNPCLLNNFDYTMFLANEAALKASGLEGKLLEGMKSVDEVATGLIYDGSPALEIIRESIKPKSPERKLNENRAALKALREAGIVEVHDIARPDQTERFYELQKAGELTCRVWLRPDLSMADGMLEKGIEPGNHPYTGEKDMFLRYGAFKGYIDGIMGTHGALFFEPYDDQPDNLGHYRRHTSNDPEMLVPDMDKMYEMIKTGYEAGFVSNVHAIGTKGVSLMLDLYEKLMNDLGHDLEGFRVIHAQVIRKEDFPRFNKLNVIAEVNPYHLSDDMRWMEERIGYDRCQGAYAFKSLLENGAILSFGSDWPGTSAAEYLVHPGNLIHAAVNRTTINHEPEGGWFPEQKIPVHEALKAYTVNNAYAAFESDVRGTIEKGKIADIAVCDLNLIKCDPHDILNMNILMTIVDGKVVFEKD